MLLAVALAALTLGAEVAPQGESPVATVFATYCQVDPKTTQPYCRQPVPENVQWLVLYSLCSTTDRADAYRAVCDAFDKDVVGTDTSERRFLNFDPRVDRWAGATYKARRGERCENDTVPDAMNWYCKTAANEWLDITETGLATVTRAASDDIPVVIVGVNPLLYGTTPVTVTSEDIEALGALQEIALGLGGVLQSGIGLFAQGKIDSSKFFAMSRADPGFTLPTSEKPEPLELTKVLEARDRALEDMADASRDLAEAAGAMEIARSQALVSIQEAEQAMGRTGVALTTTIRTADSASEAYAELQSAYAKLDAGYRALRDFGEPCRPLLKDFLFIIQHAADPAEVLRPYLDSFVAKRRSHAECVGDFDKLAGKVLADAIALAAKTNEEFPAAIKDLNTRYNAGLKLVINPPAKAEDAEAKDPAPLDVALDLLTVKRNTGLSTFNALVTGGMRRQAYCFGGTLMMTWLYVEPKTDQLPWSKVQTHAFSLKKNAPLSNGVTGSLPDDTALKYKLQSNKATGVGVGLGVIYTKLSQPKYDAVTNPANKDEKIVSQVDTDTLAGQLALFADWRLLSLFSRKAEQLFVRPSLQVGTNVSTTPGFFVGLGADFFKYFRFGWGRTWQQSKRLSPTQILDQTVVGSAADIKTEDFFAKGQYFSFSFALDSLPLFRKSDSTSGSEAKSKEKSAGATEGGDAAAAEKKKTSGQG